MKRLIAYKYRIYPTSEQEIFFSKHFGARRFIFNYYLNLNIERQKNQEKHLSEYDINKDITQLKKEHVWLKEMDDWCLKNASNDLSIAYKNFFNSCKGKRKKVGFPKFKKKSTNQKYRTKKYVTVNFNKSLIALPKCNILKIGSGKDSVISHATGERASLPLALQKQVIQIQRSTHKCS